VNLSLISGKSKQVFVQEARALSQPDNDPYHLVNNYWRVKTDSAENSNDLKKRISNYIKHLALLLKASEERQEQSVDFTYSKGPVKIYSGGIGILPYDLTPDSWKLTFHNDSNALQAYHLYEKCL